MVELIDSGELRNRLLGFRRAVSHDFIKPLLGLSDAFIILCASVIGNAAYQIVNQGESDLGTYAGIGLFSAVGYLLAAHYFQLYQPQEFMHPRVEYERIFASWLFMMLLLAVFFFLMKLGGQVSRGSIVCFIVPVLPVLTLWRMVAKRIIQTEMRLGTIRGRRALVLGTADELFSVTSDYLLTHHGVEDAERVLLPSIESDGLRRPHMQRMPGPQRTFASTNAS